MLNDDLSQMPLHARCRDLLAEMINEGVNPTVVLTAMHLTALTGMIQTHGVVAMAQVLRGMADNMLANLAAVDPPEPAHGKH